MDMYTLLAEAFDYPYPGLVQKLEQGLAEVDKGPARKELQAFLRSVKRLSLEEWEELATRTLDLSPAAAPYIGFQIWGEGYGRGEFMSKLNFAMQGSGVDVGTELPDHIVPVLRYLGVAHPPIPELAENFGPAVDRMLATLRSKDRGNPYLRLLEAALQLSPRLENKEKAG